MARRRFVDMSVIHRRVQATDDRRARELRRRYPTPLFLAAEAWPVVEVALIPVSRNCDNPVVDVELVPTSPRYQVELRGLLVVRDGGPAVSDSRAVLFGRSVRDRVRRRLEPARCEVKARKTLEVHAHTFVRGPRAGGHYERDGTWHTGTFHHSHVDGGRAHGHPETGPACFTIDKDDWYRKTGLRGGGRKVFTATPTGEQFPIEELQDWEKTFTVIVGTPTPPAWGTGPGVAPAVRMVLGFGMRAVVRRADGAK